MNEPERIDVYSFAERVGRSKRQIYKHIKSGRIPAIKPHKNAAYEIEVSEIESFISEFGPGGSQDDTVNPSEQSRRDTDDTSRHDPLIHDQTRTKVNPSSPPVEVYEMLIEKLTRAERRNVELEILLRQSQMLLTENAKSLQQDRAEKLQAEAEKEKTLQEATLMKTELESLKTEVSRQEQTWAEIRKPWWRRMFSTGRGA